MLFILFKMIVNNFNDSILYGNFTKTNTTTSNCRLLGSTFSYLIQCVLLFITMSVLIYKRHIEENKRTWKVWSFDISKQSVGSFIEQGWLDPPAGGCVTYQLS